MILVFVVCLWIGLLQKGKTIDMNKKWRETHELTCIGAAFHDVVDDEMTQVFGAALAYGQDYSTQTE